MNISKITLIVSENLSGQDTLKSLTEVPRCLFTVQE